MGHKKGKRRRNNRKEDSPPPYDNVSPPPYVAPASPVPGAVPAPANACVYTIVERDDASSTLESFVLDASSVEDCSVIWVRGKSGTGKSHLQHWAHCLAYRALPTDCNPVSNAFSACAFVDLDTQYGYEGEDAEGKMGWQLDSVGVATSVLSAVALRHTVILFGCADNLDVTIKFCATALRRNWAFGEHSMQTYVINIMNSPASHKHFQSVMRLKAQAASGADESFVAGWLRKSRMSFAEISAAEESEAEKIRRSLSDYWCENLARTNASGHFLCTLTLANALSEVRNPLRGFSAPPEIHPYACYRSDEPRATFVSTWNRDQLASIFGRITNIDHPALHVIWVTGASERMAGSVMTPATLQQLTEDGFIVRRVSDKDDNASIRKKALDVLKSDKHVIMLAPQTVTSDQILNLHLLAWTMTSMEDKPDSVHTTVLYSVCAQPLPPRGVPPGQIQSDPNDMGENLRHFTTQTDFFRRALGLNLEYRLTKRRIAPSEPVRQIVAYAVAEKETPASLVATAPTCSCASCS